MQLGIARSASAREEGELLLPCCERARAEMRLTREDGDSCKQSVPSQCALRLAPHVTPPGRSAHDARRPGDRLTPPAPRRWRKNYAGAKSVGNVEVKTEMYKTYTRRAPATSDARRRGGDEYGVRDVLVRRRADSRSARSHGHACLQIDSHTGVMTTTAATKPRCARCSPWARATARGASTTSRASGSGSSRRASVGWSTTRRSCWRSPSTGRPRRHRADRADGRRDLQKTARTSCASPWSWCATPRRGRRARGCASRLGDIIAEKCVSSRWSAAKSAREETATGTPRHQDERAGRGALLLPCCPGRCAIRSNVIHIPCGDGSIHMVACWPTPDRRGWGGRQSARQRRRSSTRARTSPTVTKSSTRTTPRSTDSTSRPRYESRRLRQSGLPPRASITAANLCIDNRRASSQERSIRV